MRVTRNLVTSSFLMRPRILRKVKNKKNSKNKKYPRKTNSNSGVIKPKRDFPKECLEEIFSHLNSTDLLECTKVCHEWNELIGSTRSCMKKIKVNLAPNYSKTLDKDALMDSNRKYECVKLSRNYSIEDHKFLLAKGRKWTQVSAVGTRFGTSSAFVEFLKLVRSDVEKLVLQAVKVENEDRNDYSAADLQFPKLKHLQVKENTFYSPSYYQALDNCKNLETISLELSRNCPLDVVRTIMVSNISKERLKSLKYAGEHAFHFDFSSQLNFKLTELSVAKLPEGQNYRQNFISFLRSQMDSLETITIGKWMGFDVMATVFSMTRLKKLTLEGLCDRITDDSDDAAGSFPPNESVTSLSIENIGFPWPLTVLILQAFPNLEFLEIFDRVNAIVSLIPENLKSLKHLRFHNFNGAISNESKFILESRKIELQKIKPRMLAMGSSSHIFKF